MSKKDDMFWHICDQYEYYAFTQNDEDAFTEMAYAFKKLNRNNYDETLADLELAKKEHLTEREYEILNIVFNKK